MYVRTNLTDMTNLNVAADDGQLHGQPEDDTGNKLVLIVAHLREVFPRHHTKLCREQLCVCVCVCVCVCNSTHA